MFACGFSGLPRVEDVCRGVVAGRASLLMRIVLGTRGTQERKALSTDPVAQSLVLEARCPRRDDEQRIPRSWRYEGEGAVGVELKGGM